MSLASRSLRLTAAVAAVALIGAGLSSVSAGTAPSAAAAVADATDYAGLVNPFVSTEDDFGQDLVGAEAPTSIVKINPMTAPGRSHSGYDYAEDQISGFTHTNLNGVGGSGAGGDLLVVPTYQKYTSRPGTGTYAKDYSHADEKAEPGYYAVDLATDAGAIRAEATTDVRTGQDRFTFPEAGTASLVVDLRNNFTSRRGATLGYETLDDGRVALSGDFTGHFNGYDYRMHYYVETTAPAAGVRTWGGSGDLSGQPQRDGTDIGAILDFEVDAGQQVGLTVAISPISVEQAKIDLAAEMGDRSFEQVRQETRAAWNEILGRLAVTASGTSDPDGELQTLFYTHLYRMFGTPVNATSTSGTYRGLDGEVHQADGYTHYDGWGFWDDFRKYEILAIGYPEVFRDMAQSVVDLYGSFASTGKGSLSNVTHSVPTVRFERAAIVVADAVAKGAQLRGLGQAWPALVSQSQGGYADEGNARRGYIANEVDDTLGTSYDDWAMATIADALGKTDEAQHYRLRAANWTNLFKPNAVTLADGTRTGLIFPKDANGAWVDADPERFEAANLYQGTLWQYHWYAAADMGGLIDKMGGEETTREALSFMFGEQAPEDGKRMLHANTNEIDLQAPYLFNYVGAPARTQHWVRNIYTKETWNRYIATGGTHEVPSGGGEFTPPVKTKVFKNDPQGFLPTMDNDTGTMSSTFVAAALGLFPVAAGSDEYQIGTPFFENVRISYPSGRTFDISADGVSPDAYYIQSASLNGEAFDRTWLTYDQLTAGGELDFRMGEEPSGWAADSVAAPSLSDELPSSVYDPISAVSVSSRTFTEARAGDGTIGNSIDLRLANGTFAGADGDSLADAITAENVPAGLTFVAERTADRRVRLSLEGSAERSGALDGIDDLTVTISDKAFSRAPSTGTRELAFRVNFEGATLSMDPTRLKAAADGAVDVSATLTLSGARFAGAKGRDLVADGALALPGLPESVTATAVLDDADSATLRLTGSLGDAQRATFGLDFADAAFDGTAAAGVRGDGISGLATVTIERDQRWREKLGELLAEAELVVRGAYSAASFSAFEKARDGATETLANESASDDDLRAALDRLTRTADALQIAGTPYRVLEAEEFDASSGGRLSPENGNIGGVQVGSWIAYDGIDFGGKLPQRVTLRHANHPGDSATDEFVEVRVGAVDGPVAARVDLETTDGWNDYVTAEATVDDREALDGSNRIYLVFGGTPDPSQPNSWVANLDWAQFMKTAEDGPETAAPVRIEAETYDADNGNGLKKEGGEPPAGNVGGTWDGGRLTYDGRDLGPDPLTQVTVSASTRDDRVGDNRRLEFYLDEVSEATRVGTVDLPKTGGWANYVETTAELDEAVSGTHTVIVVMRADAVSGQEFNYVANLQWFELGPEPQEGPEVDLTGLTAAVDDAAPLLAGEDRYVSIDFAVFRAALDEARRIAAADRTTQDEADEAQRVLQAAAGQLEWRVIRQVSVSATTRTLAGKQYVSVAVTNGAGIPLDLEVETAYGSRSFTAVQPGASANVSMNSRQASIPAGEVTVTVTGVVGGETVMGDRTASYGAAG
ncbi:putative alpha-1,2-mannosidase [Promicromonospora iranensis]|uniref:Alpha-1,2-mannosidase n=2 Tax=Promicromonospora iranensis TaxID=1105144 RepID=A0ABU2CK84_9MICO|nr:glycoside hydrolase domain-containing protein [Promicromonospora iranensis]MDR7381746.1 putative alpha-1,2-mannosidase [Promicromonospora iranensis]